jgi:hypothetical protein
MRGMPTPLLPLPISTAVAVSKIIRPALKLLPPVMTSAAAMVAILAIFLQESNLAHRWQVIDARQPGRKGPARGLGQFEKGTKASRGGVWGVYLHASSRYWLAQVCEKLGVEFHPAAIWAALESNDALAVCVSRLLLFTDPKPLPAVGDEEAAFQYYLRNWRPGAYTRGNAAQRADLRAKWARNYRYALTAVQAAG